MAVRAVGGIVAASGVQAIEAASRTPDGAGGPETVTEARPRGSLRDLGAGPEWKWGGMMAGWVGRLAAWAFAVAFGASGGEAGAGGPSLPPGSEEPPVVRLKVGQDPNYINVMGKEAPRIPKFPALDKKKGMVRGYVKDAAGNPLEGATIGVRSSLVGGAYSGASGETDAEGYYEVKVPYGAAHFYNAGYTVDYGEGRAALSLHPVDGKLSSFASEDGLVENFVLLTYGIADRDALSENPAFSSNYYGGVVYIGHHTSEPDDALALPSNLRTGTEIEVTLTPEGELLGGGAGKSFVIRKAVVGSGFSIQNIPVGTYRIGVKRADGKPLNMRLNKPQNLAFGIVPAETTGEAVLTLYPDGAKSSMVIPARGSWNSVEVYVEIPEGE